MELARARGWGAWRHETTIDSVEKNAGRVGKLTGATKTARMARKEGENGEGKEARGSLPTSYPSAG